MTTSEHTRPIRCQLIQQLNLNVPDPDMANTLSIIDEVATPPPNPIRPQLGATGKFGSEYFNKHICQLFQVF